MAKTLGEQILDELVYRGPMLVKDLAEHLKRDEAAIRSALAGLHRGDKEPQLITYRDGKIARASTGER